VIALPNEKKKNTSPILAIIQKNTIGQAGGSATASRKEHQRDQTRTSQPTATNSPIIEQQKGRGGIFD